MSKVKVAEVRINKKKGLIQIKVNKGANHILTGEDFTNFISTRDSLLEAYSISNADLLTATDYIEGKRHV